MVSDLIWAPDFFGPQEIWSLRNLVPKKFDPRVKFITWLFHAGPKLLRDQISCLLGLKFLGDQKIQGPKYSGAKIRSWTISVKVQVF